MYNYPPHLVNAPTDNVFSTPWEFATSMTPGSHDIISSPGQRDFRLGYHFDATEPDTDLAMYWYRRAAKGGHDTACLNLGVLYETGHQGRIQGDPGSAAYWYWEARALSKAMFNLGRLFWSGNGVPTDRGVAYRLFLSAASDGNVMAMVNVGAMCIAGHGISTDYAAAKAWLSLAARHGNAVAHQNLGLLYEFRGDNDRAMYHYSHATGGQHDRTVGQELSDSLREGREPLIFT